MDSDIAKNSELVERLAREAEVGKLHTVVINGDTYAKAALVHMKKPRPEEFKPGHLQLSTLQGLVDYIRDKPDSAFGEGRKPFILIENPTSVAYGLGAGGPGMDRSWLAQAKAEVPALKFGDRRHVEDFLVELRTLYLATPAVKMLVDLLSHIDVNNAITVSDDGLSQKVVVNRGVRGAEGVAIVNPIPLQPFRTFSKVTQPESPFLLRLHAGNPGTMPMVSLTEADLGQWKLAAVENIKAFLTDSNVGCAIYG